MPATETPALANATVLIVRHAEKPPEGDGLTSAGEARARAYVQYFKKYRLTHIFAASDSKKSRRPRLTVEPLAASLRQKVDVRFPDSDPAALVKELGAQRYGGRILISWRHGKIPGLIEAFGADPKKLLPAGRWPDDVFDEVIELRYDRKGQLLPEKAKLIHENLMPGDSHP
ncbi:hypothetical protein OP10G_1143 [Fimbriimonas ginsengisoli Gsoil 348]|uniref:Histidine phosphatase family protein n=2 Tax=Fimbriimonas ginsengisoli TaxID=1005039 RepID=A0A068NM12_FIMGI|nr:hypothetical protein OP10G_1143 [Fimbriimonas ginsengisoli Gsoil 348]